VPCGVAYRRRWGERDVSPALCERAAQQVLVSQPLRTDPMLDDRGGLVPQFVSSSANPPHEVGVAT
jgi:hypothetical protein